MSMLREYIRELLTEAAKKPRDLPAGVHIVIDPHAHHSGAVIHYADEDGDGLVATHDGPWGEVYVSNIEGREYGPCGGAWKVSAAHAGSGWGPMLYDVAMEYATVMGAGLIADRDAVSKDARAVWDYYLSRRGDVKIHQLDDLKNTLTPDIEEDNCEQNVATYSTGYPSTNTTDWTKSPLSKRYTKEMSTMNALIALDKLVEL